MRLGRIEHRSCGSSSFTRKWPGEATRSGQACAVLAATEERVIDAGAAVEDLVQLLRGRRSSLPRSPAPVRSAADPPPARVGGCGEAARPRGERVEAREVGAHVERGVLLGRDPERREGEVELRVRPPRQLGELLARVAGLHG
jgi:hypothetical protein